MARLLILVVVTHLTRAADVDSCSGGHCAAASRSVLQTQAVTAAATEALEAAMEAVASQSASGGASGSHALPPGWRATKNPGPDGKVYYVNDATGAMQWKVPVAATPPSPNKLIVLQSSLDCDFEPGFCKWAKTWTGQYQWETNFYTPSTSTGPQRGGHSGQGSKFAYVEASGYNYPNKKFILSSPLINADIPFQFEFWYNMHGAGMGGISLKIYDNISPGSVVWTKSGNLGDKWHLTSVFVPAGTVQLRFEAVTGPTWASDFALDDFSVKVATTTTTTQAETTNILCGSGKFCVGVEGNDIFCYGASNGCLWNRGCATNDDCRKYTSASPKFSNPGPEICPSQGWMADACAKQPAIQCGSGKFCVGVEGNDIFCYGSSIGCLWNRGCATNDDCRKYTSASPKFSNPGQEICPSKGWMADACA